MRPAACNPEAQNRNRDSGIRWLRGTAAVPHLGIDRGELPTRYHEMERAMSREDDSAAQRLSLVHTRGGHRWHGD